VTAFVNGALSLSSCQRDLLWRAGVLIEERRVRRLVAGPGQRLSSVELEDGTRMPQEALVVRPPQRQVALVERLGLELDERGYVRVDGHEETSLPGLHAAGDLTSRVQSAALSAAAGTRAAYAINHLLNLSVQPAVNVQRSATLHPEETGAAHLP